jgi:hypothetical protein
MSNKAQITTVARFKEHTFLENIVVRRDGSILVTAYLNKQVFYIPKPGNELVMPQLLHQFDQFTTGIVEVHPDVFYISTTSVTGATRSHLWKLDMNGFVDGISEFPEPVMVFTFPEPARALNGSCLIGPRTMVLADSWADMIWRVDIPEDGPGDGSAITSGVWLKHDMLAHVEEKPDSPGVNGIKYNHTDQHVYFTSTAQTIFGRVKVNPETLEAGEPEEIAERGMKDDDLLIDEVANVGYVTTHRQNTIEKFDLNNFCRTCVVGNPTHINLLGPTAGAWSREPGEYGRVAYFSTDGGHMNPFKGKAQMAAVVRVEFLEGTAREPVYNLHNTFSYV